MFEFTPQQLDAELDALISSNARYFEQMQVDNFVPQVMLVTQGMGDTAPKHTLMLLADAPLDDYEAKHAMLEQIGEFVFRNEEMLLAAFFISEAWSRAGGVAEGMKVADYDDKIEVLVSAGMSYKGDTVMAVQPMDRDAEANITLRDPSMVQHANGRSSDEKLENNLCLSIFRGYLHSIELAKLVADSANETRH